MGLQYSGTQNLMIKNIVEIKGEVKIFGDDWLFKIYPYRHFVFNRIDS